MPEDRILIFDFDGVMVDSLEYFYASFITACREQGFDQIASREAFLRLFETNLFTGLVQAGFPEASIGGLLDSMARVMKETRKRFHFYPDMASVLDRLGAQNRIVVVTTNISTVVQRFLRRQGVTCVKSVLGSDKGISKAEKIRRVRQKMGDGEAWYIGDTRGDILEAREAGVLTVAAAWGWHPAELLQSANPDKVAHLPVDLLDLFGA